MNWHLSMLLSTVSVTLGLGAEAICEEPYMFENRTAGLELPAPRQVPRVELIVPQTGVETIKRHAAPVFIGNWETAEEGSAIIRTGWTNEGLIIHAEVFDDKIEPARDPNSLWRGDAIEIYLDLRPAKERTKGYLDQSGVGQFVLAPPASVGAGIPQIGKGSGDLSPFFDLNDLKTGYKRTDAGYELWVLVPKGPWLKPGANIYADFCLDDQDGDRGTGSRRHENRQFFAFGATFNWKETTRFGILSFSGKPACKVFMNASSIMGIAGRQGSHDAFESIRCSAFSLCDLSKAELSIGGEGRIDGVTSSMGSKKLGGTTLFKRSIGGNSSGSGDITFTLTLGTDSYSQAYPSNAGVYREILKAVDAVDKTLPSGHDSHLMAEIAREDVLNAMHFNNLGAQELLRSVNRHLGIAKDLAAGREHPRVLLRGYYSKAQGRWIPFAIFKSRDMQAGRKTGLDFYLHGYSGADFTRMAFVEQKIFDADSAARENLPFPQRPVVYFYGAGNDYTVKGTEDWEKIPKIVFDTLKVDPQDVHLSGHSMGAWGTFAFGATIGDIVPGVSFATFSPVAGGIDDERYKDSSAYSKYVGERNGDKVLAAANYQKRPFLLIHGIEDKNVPLESSLSATRWLESIGNPVDILEIPAQGHGPQGYETIRDIWLKNKKGKWLAEWTAYLPRLGNIRGLQVVAFQEWGKPGVIRFTGKDSIITKNVSVLDISGYVSETGALSVNDAKADVRQKLFYVDLPSKGGFAAGTKLKTRDSSGPVLEFARRGFVIVSGTLKPESAERLFKLSQRLRNSVLRSEWGMKEDSLMIYKDTDTDIPSDLGVIVVGGPDENAYAAKLSGTPAAKTADELSAIRPSSSFLDSVFSSLAGMFSSSGTPHREGFILLTSDRHLLIQGSQTFYEKLSSLPMDSDFQLWASDGETTAPVVEGEFDNFWRQDKKLMRFMPLPKSGHK